MGEVEAGTEGTSSREALVGASDAIGEATGDEATLEDEEAREMDVVSETDEAATSETEDGDEADDNDEDDDENDDADDDKDADEDDKDAGTTSLESDGDEDGVIMDVVMAEDAEEITGRAVEATAGVVEARRSTTWATLR